MADVRAAVIGAGLMGRHHVRILGTMPGVELAGIVDPALDASHPHVRTAGAPVFGSVAELPDIDFAVVATPTEYHVATALELMARGVNIMVEKPLAGTVEEAEQLVTAAADAGVVLAVGHVERFNAAVNLLARMAEDPRLVQFERLSPYTPRIRDSVIFDLMVHDLDLACWICGGYPVRVQASGTAVFSDQIDVAAAVLEFENGCVAAIEASRVTQDKVRRVAVSEPARYLVADSIRQDVSIRRQTDVEFVDEGQSLYRQASVVEIPYLDRSGEPLARELADVLDAVRTGGQPTVTGEDGLAAVRLAKAVEESIAQS